MEERKRTVLIPFHLKLIKDKKCNGAVRGEEGLRSYPLSISQTGWLAKLANQFNSKFVPF